jgi:putative membrane protein
MTAMITLAFLHHAAAFLLVAVVTVELVLVRGELTLGSARSLVRMDAAYGVAAAVILIVGLLRVFYTEKGSAYYFHSGTFLAKLALFVIVGLLSIYPTLQFLSWRKTLAAQQVPTLAADTRRRIRLVLHVELTLLFLLMLFAVMMARGIGYFG